MIYQQAYLSPMVNKVCYMWAFIDWLAQMAAVPFVQYVIFTLLFLICFFIYWTILHYATSEVLQNNSFC